MIILCSFHASAQNVPNGSTTPSASGVKALPVGYSGTPVNYLRVFSPQVPIADTSTINMSAAVEDVQTAVTYTDSYGRTLETIARKLSPAKKDNVVSPFYDDFGRAGSVSYLPFADTGSNGLFKANPFQRDSAFYKNLFPDEQVLYQQTIYDSSPFNIPLKQMGIGNEWGGAGRGDTMIHRSSAAADSVRYFTVDINSIDDLPATSGYYVAGSLSVLQIINAAGVKSIVYKDLAGRTILTKSQLLSSPATGHYGWLCTYYIYDETGRLRAVIPPKATEALAAASWTFSGHTDIYTGLCYAYYYDSRGRQIVKAVPGKGKSYVAYDLFDRPVMTQDNRLLATNQWAFVLYDAQSRPVKSGVITNTAIKDSIWAQASRSSSYPALSGTYTVMTESYYDDYDWVSATSAPLSSSMNTTNTGSPYFLYPGISPDYAGYLSQSIRIRGAMTGSKTLVLGTSDFIYNVTFYDKEGRAIQTQQKNYTGGTDIATTQFNYRGNILRSLLVQQKSGTNAQTHKIWSRYSYDHAGRLLTLIKNIDSTGDKTIIQNAYAETGSLETTILGNNLQTETYSYNIQGMITGINSGYVASQNDTTLFGEKLSYAHGFSSAQYSGMISGVQWRSGGDAIARAYGYHYDNAGRLTDADFTQQNEGDTSWMNDQVDYSVSGISYDAGGNILTMQQEGMLGVGASVPIDELVYSYFSNSNRLQKITDASPAYHLGDFTDSTNSGDDYAYDSTGNIIKDYNRHLYTSGGAGAHFNLLDKPDSMVVAGKSTTYYTYDAGGNMLKKKVKDYVHSTTSEYIYVGGFVYLNDTMQFASMEAGRIRIKDNGAGPRGVYDYFIKDHAGNVRAVLTDEQRSDQYPAATMETADTALEKLYYNNITATRVTRPPGYPNYGELEVGETSDGNRYVAKVQGSESLHPHTVGPSIVLKVMAGDSFNISVYSWYRQNTTSPGTPSSPFGDLINGIINTVSGSAVLNTHGVTSGDLIDAEAFNTGISDFLDNQDSYTVTTKPKAFLNWILFDERFNYVADNSGFDQVGADSTLKLHVENGLPISRSGYLYIYVSNESANIPVYFDNLQVTHVRGKLLETDEYYPYGLEMKNISYRAAGAMQNRSKYNGGNDFEDEGELNYSNTFFRKYDSQIGRFTGVDMLADEFAGITPYHFGGNNPVMFNDVTGAKYGEGVGWANELRRVGYINSHPDQFDSYGNFIGGASIYAGGGGGGESRGSITAVEGGYTLTGTYAQQAFADLIKEYNNSNSDGEWSVTFGTKNGSFRSWEREVFQSDIKGDGGVNLSGVSIGGHWETYGDSGPGPCPTCPPFVKAFLDPSVTRSLQSMAEHVNDAGSITVGVGYGGGGHVHLGPVKFGYSAGAVQANGTMTTGGRFSTTGTVGNVHGEATIHEAGLSSNSSLATISYEDGKLNSGVQTSGIIASGEFGFTGYFGILSVGGSVNPVAVGAAVIDMGKSLINFIGSYIRESTPVPWGGNRSVTGP